MSVGGVAAATIAALALTGCGSSSGGSTAGPSSGASSASAPEVNPAGDIPDSQVFVPFTPPGADFTVSVPQGWAQSAAGTATAFTDKFNSVRLESVPAATAPDVAGVRSTEVPRLQAALAAHSRVLDTPAPVVQLTNFVPNGMEVTIKYWLTDPNTDQDRVKSEVNLAILDVLSGENIDVPGPQRVVLQGLPLPPADDRTG